MSELKKLKYTRNVLHETLRCYTLAPFAARYDTHRDIEFHDGSRIPKGMPVVLPLGKVLTDPELWDRPEEFIPERFENPESKRPLLFSPFGFAGGRICPGRSLTYCEG
jgi:cytochrome P450 family 20 subfamily A